MKKKPKKETMITFLLFTVIMMLKICSVIVLCSKRCHAQTVYDDASTGHAIK